MATKEKMLARRGRAEEVAVLIPDIPDPLYWHNFAIKQRGSIKLSPFITVASSRFLNFFLEEIIYAKRIFFRPRTESVWRFRERLDRLCSFRNSVSYTVLAFTVMAYSHLLVSFLRQPRRLSRTSLFGRDLGPAEAPQKSGGKLDVYGYDTPSFSYYFNTENKFSRYKKHRNLLTKERDWKKWWRVSGARGARARAKENSLTIISSIALNNNVDRRDVVSLIRNRAIFARGEKRDVFFFRGEGLSRHLERPWQMFLRRRRREREERGQKKRKERETKSFHVAPSNYSFVNIWHSHVGSSCFRRGCSSAASLCGGFDFNYAPFGGWKYLTVRGKGADSRGEINKQVAEQPRQQTDGSPAEVESSALLILIASKRALSRQVMIAGGGRAEDRGGSAIISRNHGRPEWDNGDRDGKISATGTRSTDNEPSPAFFLAAAAAVPTSEQSASAGADDADDDCSLPETPSTSFRFPLNRFGPVWTVKPFPCLETH